MKKLALISAVSLFLLFYYSCTKDKTPVPVTCIPTDSVNTYTNSAKAILDGYCLGGGCHSGGGAGGVGLDNYTNAVKAAKTNVKFFCSIDWTCEPHMPQGYFAPIDTSEINALLRWRDNCYAQ